jgi:hypothetical protein
VEGNAGETPLQKGDNAQIGNDKAIQGKPGKVIQIFLQGVEILPVKVYIEGAIEFFVPLDPGYFLILFSMEIIRLPAEGKIFNARIGGVGAVEIGGLEFFHISRGGHKFHIR